MKQCKPIKHLDEFQCHQCGKSWGEYEEQPVTCGEEFDRKAYGNGMLKQMKENLSLDLRVEVD